MHPPPTHPFPAIHKAVTDFLARELDLDWTYCTGISFVEAGIPLRFANTLDLAGNPESAVHLKPIKVLRRVTCSKTTAGADVSLGINSSNAEQAEAAKRASAWLNVFSVFRGHSWYKPFLWRATARPLLRGATRCLVTSLTAAAIVSGACVCPCSAHAM